MNLLYGKIESVVEDDGLPVAKIRFGRVFKRASLLISDAGPGDTVLVCDGAAIGKVDDDRKEKAHVLGDSR